MEKSEQRQCYADLIRCIGELTRAALRGDADKTQQWVRYIRVSFPRGDIAKYYSMLFNGEKLA